MSSINASDNFSSSKISTLLCNLNFVCWFLFAIPSHAFYVFMLLRSCSNLVNDLQIDI